MVLLHFFVGAILDSKDKNAKELIKKSTDVTVTPSHERNGKIIIYDYSSSGYSTEIWFDLNNNQLIRRLGTQNLQTNGLLTIISINYRITF